MQFFDDLKSLQSYYNCISRIILKVRYEILPPFKLFVTSQNQATNLPINEFKVLHKSQRAFLMVYYSLFIILKNIFFFAAL